ncbi:MAG: arsinothricin resistance N-acetyltransferase ArsN1 family B [Planctomycetota bacterium]
MAPLTARQIGGALLRDATPADAAALAAIYNHYILHTVVTFEEQVIDAAEMARRLAAVMAQHPWLVLEADGELLGYAYAGTWKPRSAYRFTVETTVYLAAQAVGAGLGSRLYEALLLELRRRGLHVAIGGITLPNAASVALHEKFGFRKVAHFSEQGWKFGQWLDVGYWQLTLSKGPPA